VKSDDTRWEQMAAYNKVKLGQGHRGKTLVALATREGKTYALVKLQGGGVPDRGGILGLQCNLGLGLLRLYAVSLCCNLRAYVRI
jgi:hypothetical protein